LACMKLQQVSRERWDYCGQRRPLKRTRRDHHSGSFDRRIVGRDDKAPGCRIAGERNDLCVAPHTSVEEVRIVLDEPRHLFVMRKRVGLVAFVCISRKFKRPVGKLEVQGIPALTVPSLRHAATLEDEMLPRLLTEMVAHGQTRLSAAD